MNVAEPPSRTVMSEGVVIEMTGFVEMTVSVTNSVCV